MDAVRGALRRVALAWRALAGEQRIAAWAAIALFVTMLLPWYQLQRVSKSQIQTHDVNAFGVFSFVEAAVLLVAAGVITLLFQRAEGRPFHLPGGDGGVITAAGVWTCVLVVWRIFDKQGGQAQKDEADSQIFQPHTFLLLHLHR